MQIMRPLAASCCLLVVVAWIGTRPSYHEAVRLSSELQIVQEVDTLGKIDSLVFAAIRNRAFPGASVAVGYRGRIVKLAGYGNYSYGTRKAVTPESPFDLASLTKVVATTTAAMQLYEAGRLDLDATVHSYLPEFAQNGKQDITIRHLLTHTSGLQPFIFFHQIGITDRETVVDSIYALALNTPPGKEYRYSDFSMIVLAFVIERITGQDFGTYARDYIFEPLGMHATGFREPGVPDPEVVPTEMDDYFRFRLVQGEVHDETSWILGGDAGHAGLFSTAADLARFATMLAQQGQTSGGQFLQPETIRLFTTAVDTTRHTRALGWDTRSQDEDASAGVLLGPRSFGHTGFTGTSIWIDPDAELFVILLTNRVFPRRENYKYVKVRPAVADAAYEAILGRPAE